MLKVLMSDCVCSVCSVAVEVVSTKTTADVMWKDGRVEKGIRSNDLIPIQHLDSHEFCPGDFVVDKRRKENECVDPNTIRTIISLLTNQIQGLFY